MLWVDERRRDLSARQVEPVNYLPRPSSASLEFLYIIPTAWCQCYKLLADPLRGRLLSRAVFGGGIDLTTETLTVPPRHDAGLQAVLRMEDEELARLASVLESTQPTLERSAFARTVADKLGMRSRESDRIVSFLVSLYTVRANLDLEIPVFADAFKGIARELAEEGRIDATEAQLDALPSRLERLLGLEDTVGVVSKAIYLWSQHENVFSDAQILTDVRPVFQSDATVAPAAAMIVHKLRITYRRPQERYAQDIFLALDSEDIASLRRALDRAEKKAQSLSEGMTGSSMRILEEKKTDGR